jgi:transcriptional regulator with XRE-family HTH domain
VSKRSVPMRPVVHDGLAVLGNLVREARVGRHWTRAELAQRANVSPVTITKIENGEPGTAVGTVFSVADLVGVPLFGIEDRAELARLRRLGQERIALLPARVRHSRMEDLDDDF